MSEFHTEQAITQQKDVNSIVIGKAEFTFCGLREARSAFRKLSRGELELLSGTYHGDEHRHHAYHETCGGHSWISLDELQSLALDQFCPHCHGIDDLTRFGSLENLQYTVCRASGYNAYFFGINPIAHADHEYTFWCSLHRCSYQATFRAFWGEAGATNACPHCVEAAKKAAG